MAVERYWTISVCRAHPYRRVVLQDGRPWCLECGDKVAKFENLKVVPASDYDRLLSACKEEVERLRSQQQQAHRIWADESKPKEIRCAERGAERACEGAADRLIQVIESLEGGGG